MKLNEHQQFVNAVRACLGLGPLYGISQKTSYQSAEIVDPFYGVSEARSREMLDMSGGGVHQMTREEFRSIGTSRSLSKLKTRGRVE